MMITISIVVLLPRKGVNVGKYAGPMECLGLDAETFYLS